MSEVKKTLLALGIAVFLPILMVRLVNMDSFPDGPLVEVFCDITTAIISIGLITGFGLVPNTRAKFPVQKVLLIGGIIGFGTIIPAGIASMIMREISSFPMDGTTPLQWVQSQPNQASKYIPILQSIILAPIAEELFFRVFLANQLRRTFTAPLAIIVSAAIFANIHGLVMKGQSLEYFYRLDFLPLLTMGIILGAVYLKYGWIASMAAHSVFNMKNHYVPESPDLWAIPYAFAMIAGFVVLILLFLPKFRKGVRFEH